MANVARANGTIDPARATFLLPFNDEYYHVPVNNVLLLPKWTNTELEDTVLQVLNTRDPQAWSRFIACGRVAHIRGQEGSAVYTTFAIPDGAEDFTYQRVLHQVPSNVAHECFPTLKEWARCAYTQPTNARQQGRITVYDWRKETHLPNHDKIDPVANGWPRSDTQGSPFLGAVEPPAWPSPQGAADPMIEYEAFLEQSAQPAPPPIPSGVREIRPWEYDPWRLPPPQLLPRQPPPAYSGRADDLRKLSEFLFECKDTAPEGAYLEASNALQRLWDNVV